MFVLFCFCLAISSPFWTALQTPLTLVEQLMSSMKCVQGVSDAFSLLNLRSKVCYQLSIVIYTAHSH